MLRALFVAAATATAILGTTIGAAPPAIGEPLNGDCIAGKMNENGSCYYKNCSEARANGECDIPEGDPHYCDPQDRDQDGVACEC